MTLLHFLKLIPPPPPPNTHQEARTTFQGFKLIRLNVFIKYSVFPQKYLALYDYNAADDDEVSFVENDLIIEVTVIDEGWMEGRVERTGQYGMLPSNYVEKI